MTETTPPTPAFAALARRLLQSKREIMETQECRSENAMDEARFGLVWHFRLDAIAKGSILGIGAGGLLLSSLGPAAVFGGLALAALGIKVARDAIECAHMVDQAYDLYNRMAPAEFTRYLNSATAPLRAPQAS